MKRAVLRALWSIVLLAPLACNKPHEPAPPPPSPRVQSLLCQRAQLQAARADVVAANGADNRSVRVMDHEIALVDQQIELEKHRYEPPQ